MAEDPLDPDPHTLVRRDDAFTSHLAAVDTAGNRRTHRVRILQALTAAGDDGLTYPEAGEATGIDPIETMRRISDLLNAGLAIPLTDYVGRAVVRRLPSGRLGRVYAVANPATDPQQALF